MDLDLVGASAQDFTRRRYYTPPEERGTPLEQPYRATCDALFETYRATHRALTERFPPETVVYSGHGPPTTLGTELARNPFLAPLRVS